MECSNCGKNFALNKNLKRGSGPITEKNVSKCPECGEKVEKGTDDNNNSTLLEKGI